MRLNNHIVIPKSNQVSKKKFLKLNVEKLNHKYVETLFSSGIIRQIQNFHSTLLTQSFQSGVRVYSASCYCTFLTASVKFHLPLGSGLV